VILGTTKLHNLHKYLEWSGQLLYTKNNFDFRSASLIKVKTEDFIPYDLGNAVATTIDYENDNIREDIVNYIPDYWADERLLDDELQIQNGIIHSHHSMETFFSTTDQPTLIEKSRAYPHGMYLSLIVNHDITWSSVEKRWKARIAWHTTWDSKTSEWVLRVGHEEIGRSDVAICVWVECDVVMNWEANLVDKTFQRYKQLYPYYSASYFGNISISREFMDNVYRLMSEGELLKWDKAAFQSWIEDYAAIHEWYTECLDTAVYQLLAENKSPFRGYSDVNYPIEWIVATIYLEHLRDLKQLDDKKLAIELATICKQYKIDNNRGGNK